MVTKKNQNEIISLIGCSEKEYSKSIKEATDYLNKNTSKFDNLFSELGKLNPQVRAIVYRELLKGLTISSALPLHLAVSYMDEIKHKLFQSQSEMERKEILKLNEKIPSYLG